MSTPSPISPDYWEPPRDEPPTAAETIADLREQLSEMTDDRNQFAAMWRAVRAEIADLTRALADARRIAIDSGAFQDHRGTEYVTELDYPWRADTVGPVAWDKQVQQR